MITLWHCMNARSFRPLWALEEMGLRYRLRLLPFPPRVEAPEFLERNPLGTIPLLEDGAARMTESAACCQYLADRYGPTPLAVRPDEPEFAAYLNGLHYGEATLTFPQTLVLRYARFEPAERQIPQVAEDYARWFFARLRALTARLDDGREWYCGSFTMADISVGYALMLAVQIGMEERFNPTIAAYLQRLRAREGWRRADAAQHAAAAGPAADPSA